MHLDFRNTNTLWASVVVETLSRLGLTTAVICPGSRSAPLAVAFARHPAVEAIPVLDERSAAFFALGMAKRRGIPVALICTSGTAGANFYPAVIEAKESRVPLLVLTADRPLELRHCHAGQTIDQVRLYGNYPNWQTELAVPSLDREMLQYLRQTIVHAWERSRFPVSGVVHLNCPFRDPLAPIPQPVEVELGEDFFDAVSNVAAVPLPSQPLPLEVVETWQSHPRGIIIAGVAHSYAPEEYCQAIASLSQHFQYPVLAEALSPLRNYAHLNPFLIATYDLILRNRKLAQTLAPEIVIQLGELPTSKELRTWLTTLQPTRWIVDLAPDNFDPLHGKTIHLKTSIEGLISAIERRTNLKDRAPTDYLKQWCLAEFEARKAVDKTMGAIDFLLESKIAWFLSQTLPANTPLFIGNSMPVREMEFFWMSGSKGIVPYFNRGANGIDGTLSTGLGIAHRYRPSVILIGDLAFLHDINSLLINSKFVGHLTIVLINNNGGGIFEMLPISAFESIFEDFFATPQDIDFGKLCLAYGIEHKSIQTWEVLEAAIAPLPQKGIRVLELQTQRKQNSLWLQNNLDKFATKSSDLQIY